MKLFRTLISLFTKLFCITFIFFSISYTSANLLYQYFPGKNPFLYEDPYAFLLSMGIDLNKDIVYFSNFRAIKGTTLGGNKGNFYKDARNVEYFIKYSSLFQEFTGAKFMNIILPSQSATVKIVADRLGLTASKKIDNFHRQKEVDVRNKQMLGEVDVAIAQDFIGLTDRGKKNVGFLTKGSDTLIFARIDYDKSFRFANNRINSDLNSMDHLNLVMLNDSIKTYPKDQVIQSLRKIINISDQAIVLTSFHAFAALAYAGYPIDLEGSFILAQKLIERKNAFRQTLNYLIASSSQSNNQNSTRSSSKKRTKKQKKKTKKQNKKVKKSKKKGKKKNRHKKN